MGPFILILPCEILFRSGDRETGKTLGDTNPFNDFSSDRFGVNAGLTNILFSFDLSNMCEGLIFGLFPSK
jgi:hypothetical protein